MGNSHGIDRYNVERLIPRPRGITDWDSLCKVIPGSFCSQSAAVKNRNRIPRPPWPTTISTGQRTTRRACKESRRRTYRRSRCRSRPINSLHRDIGSEGTTRKSTTPRSGSTSSWETPDCNGLQYRVEEIDDEVAVAVSTSVREGGEEWRRRPSEVPLTSGSRNPWRPRRRRPQPDLCTQAIPSGASMSDY